MGILVLHQSQQFTHMLCVLVVDHPDSHLNSHPQGHFLEHMFKANSELLLLLVAEDSQTTL